MDVIIMQITQTQCIPSRSLLTKRDIDIEIHINV